MTTMIPAWIGDDLRPVEKLDVHRRGLRHPAVSVFLMDGDRTLIQQRALSKYHTPGLWANTCCTHPHWNETAEDCAKRRLTEELGIDCPDLTFRDRVEYRAEVGGGLTEHEVVDIFTAPARANRLVITPNPMEVRATRWVALDELRAEVEAAPGMYTPWLRIYLERNVAGILDDLERV